MSQMERTTKLEGKGFWFWWDKIWEAAAQIAGYLIFALACLVTFDVILRYAFNSPMMTTIAITELGILLSLCLSGVWLLQEDGFVTIDLITSNFKPKIRYAFTVFSMFLSAVVFLYVAIGAFPQTLRLIRSGEVSIHSGGHFPSALMNTPLNVFYVFLAVEFARKGFAAIRKLCQCQTEIAGMGKGSS